MMEEELIRKLPVSDLAEKSVLGSILIDPSAFDRIADMISADDFHAPEHQQIYLAMRELYLQSHEIDVVTLIDATQRRHRESAIPLITMSMGTLGALTRIGGGTFGSAATFATLGAASAPGQLPAAGVRAALDLLHRGD